MEVLVLLLFVLLIPTIVIAAIFCIFAALFLTPVILLTLPVAISDVDTCCAVGFVTRTCALRFLTSEVGLR